MLSFPHEGNYVNTLAAPFNILDIDTQLPANANNQSTFNYRYDEIGNLVRDSIEGIRATVGGIKWNVYGKITEINKVDSSAAVRNVGRFRKISYYYDAAGNRVGAKYERYAGRPTYWTWYVRDASGNVMSVYSYTDSLRLSEQYLYGSSRIGSMNPGVNLDRSAPTGTNMPLLSSTGNLNTFTRGNKFFELSNHLGNVLVTLSDKKRGVQNGTTGSVRYYLPIVKGAQDYFPFGMKMPGRIFVASGTNYRFGFNGKENDNEVKGEGNQQDYGLRIYDPRLGRFLSVDPLTMSYPWYTPYQFAGNKPIWATDVDGAEENPTNLIPKSLEVDMSKAPESFTTKSGKVFQTFVKDGRKWNSAWAWEQIRSNPNNKQFISAANDLLIDEGISPTLDNAMSKAWTNSTGRKIVKQFMGQTLDIHHFNQGATRSFPLPWQLHRGKGYTKLWHRFGKATKVLALLGVALTVSDIAKADMIPGANEMFDDANTDFNEMAMGYAMQKGYSEMVKFAAANNQSAHGSGAIGIYYANDKETFDAILNKQFPDASKTPPPKFLTGGWGTFYQGQRDAANATGQVVTHAIIFFKQSSRSSWVPIGIQEIK
jgi:RHS repeat-associated protein